MTQHLADHSENATGPDPTRPQRLAVLALVFAILVPPVGIVLGIVILRQTQRERPDAGWHWARSCWRPWSCSVSSCC